MGNREEKPEAVAGWRIEFRASAIRDFESLPRTVQERFSAKFPSLALNPCRMGSGLDVKPLAGRPGTWRLRVGSYRGICELSEALVFFTRFGHRATVYR